MTANVYISSFSFQKNLQNTYGIAAGRIIRYLYMEKKVNLLNF